MRAALTALVWIASLASLTIASVVAAAFIFMATSLDPTQIVATGLEPWTDALLAVLAFVALVVVTVLGLRLWHSVRFKPVGLALALGALAAVIWACARVYNEYS